jgi:4'-phosphopantetheinyl transferase
MQKATCLKERPHLSLWLAYPDDLSSRAAVEAAARLLSEDERWRWLSFRLDRDRRQYLATRVLVRTALARQLGSAPEDLRFSANAWGKPSIDPDHGIRFNASNSPALVVCLVASELEVGVDAEPHERAPEIAKLSHDVFSPAEQDQLEALPEPQKPERALTLWTLKESWIKARGMGLSLPLNKFSFLFSEQDAGVHLEVVESLGERTGDLWRYSWLDYAGHRIALMVDSPEAPLLERWELHPLFSEPRSLPPCSETWFPLTKPD